ncbi:MAG: glycosyltransferase family 2 protein [Bacteroidota bacterium]
MVSIITPTYNRAFLLPRMIKSVLEQSFQNWELIIMDDGSTDNTQTVVEGFKDSRIKYYFTENSGAADKRNRGSEIAEGDYIIFLDSDDEVKPNWLAEFSKKIKDGAQVVCCGIEKYNENGELIKAKLPYKYSSLYKYIEGYFLSGTFLLNKNYFIKIGGYDTNLASGHHTDFLLRLIPYLQKDKVNISNIMDYLVKIHIHKGAKIRSNNKAVLDGTLEILKKHRLLFENNKEDYKDFLSVAGTNALILGEISLGKKLLVKAYFLNPFNLKGLVRVLLAFTPMINTRFWNK